MVVADEERDPCEDDYNVTPLIFRRPENNCTSLLHNVSEGHVGGVQLKPQNIIHQITACQLSEQHTRYLSYT